MSRPSKILVTGGNGQLGMEFRALQDPRIHIVSREKLNITDRDGVFSLLENEKFDYLVNCAAYTGVDRAEEEEELCKEVNVAAVKYLADACAKYHVKLIHISSDYVYHPAHTLPLDEDDDCSPQGVYAKSKLWGENVIETSGCESIILRTSWVYSSYGNNFVKTMLKLADRTDHIRVVSDQIGSPTYAADIVSVILAIIDQEFIPGTYNFSNLGFISWADFAKAIFQLSGRSVIVEEIPSSEYPTPAPRPLNSRMIKSKIADTFGVNLHHWRKSLDKCLKEIDN